MKGRRLRDHLRRCWLIYLLGAVAALFLNEVVYTVTRPRTPESDILRVMVVDVQKEIPEDWLEAAGFEALSTEYLSMDAPQAGMLLITRMIEGKVDLCIVDREGFEAVGAWGGCGDLSGVALEGFVPVDCPVPPGQEAYTGALERDEVYLILPSGGADNEKTIAALPAIAEVLFS